MNTSIHGGIAASALLFALAAAAPVIAQSPPGANNPQDSIQGSNPQGQQVQQGMQQINSAYKELHQVTLRTLQAQANNWPDKTTGKSTSGGQDKNADRPGQSNNGSFSSTSPITLRGDELLIAGCSQGLLAGAPSGTASNRDVRKPAPLPAGGNDKSDSGQGSQSNPDRTGQTAGSAGGDGQAIGMILVSANSMGGSKAGMDGHKRTSDSEAREAADERDDAGTRNAAGSLGAGALKPGVYSVKQSGSSVWLSDQEGRTVLRTSVDAQRGNTTPKSSEFGRQDRDSTFGKSAEGQSEWETVFAAIAEEAMSSMGWAKQGAVASKL